MKSLVDVHVYLSTAEDMEDHHDDPSMASEMLNEILHMTYERADADINSHTLINQLENVWEYWHYHRDLAIIDIEDLSNWVDNELNNWNNNNKH